MKKIRCTIGTLSDAIKEVEKYQKDLDKKLKVFMERLADVGIKEATVNFGRAVYAGTNDVVVNNTPMWIDNNKLAISATGHSITFIEFGSGVHYAAQSHPKAGDFGFDRGGYGYHLGRFDTWRYKGDVGNGGLGEVITEGSHKGEILTHGNPANRSLYDAAKEMREQISKIAEEVFGND